MTRWFGPSGTCGCCTVVIPCECTEGGDCVPESPGYYQNLAVEISEVPNEIYATITGIDYSCTSRSCRPTEDLILTNDYRYSGFSQLNGTYPISFYRYDEDLNEYVEDDPATGCGYWGVADFVFDVDFTITQYEEYNPSGASPPCNARDRSGTAALTLTFKPFFAGIVEPSYPVAVPPFGNISEPLIFRHSGGTLVRSGFTLASGCNGGGTTPLSDNVNTNDPLAAITTTPSYIGALVIDPLGNNPITPPGLASGLPASAPAGMTIVNSQFCNILRVEAYSEYEQKTFVTVNVPGNCGVYRDITYGGWQVRRKLVYTGV